MALEMQIVDFETDADLTRISLEEQWLTATIDDTHALCGDKSLKAVFKNHAWPGFGVNIGGDAVDWSAYEALSFRVWTPSPLKVHLRVDDVNSTDHHSRFGATRDMKTGENLFQVRMKEIATKLDVTKIKRLIVFLTNPPAGTTLWFDDFRLGPFDDALLYTDVPPPGQRLDIVYSMSVHTPHFRWVHGGGLDVFLLPERIGGRDVVELAQRMAMRYRTVTIDRSWGTDTWGFGNFYGQRSQKHNFNKPYSYLASDLGGSDGFDVLVLQFPHGWNYIPRYARNAVLRRLEQGEGLVLIKPYFNRSEEPDARLDDFSPLVSGPDWHLDRDSGNLRRGEGASRTSASAWRKTTAGLLHPITANIDLEPLNPLDIPVHPYSPAEDAVVLVETEDGRPVLAVKEYREARVAAFAFENRSLTPAYAIPLTGKPRVPFRYQDYYYGLLARTAMWCAGALPEAGLRVVSLDDDGGRALLLDRLPDGAKTVAVSLESELGEEMEVQAAGADGRRVEFPAAFLGTDAVARLVAKDADGHTVDFSWLLLKSRSAAKPALNVEADAEAPRGQPVRWNVKTENMPSQNWTLHVALFDTFGRKIAERSPAAFDSADAALEGTFSSGRSMTRCLKVVAEAYSGGILLGRAESRPVLTTGWEIERDDYMVIQWPNETHAFLAELERRMMRQWGSDGLFSYESDSHDKLLKNVADNFLLFEFGVNRRTFQYNIFTGEFGRQKQAWEQTKDKRHLARVPCLSEPASFDKSRENIERRAAARVKYSIAGWSLGEESSLTSYREAIDFCHSPACILGFQNAMKGRYAEELESLNRHWGTSFASWNDVAPMTLEEAKSHGSPAPWLLHRLFMDEVWCAHIAYSRDLIHKIDPQAVVGTTGTQEPTPHDGHNWPVMSKSYDFLMPYTYADQQEYHVSFGGPEFFSMPPAGYGNSGDGVTYSTWESVFYRGLGHVMFWWIALVEPDLTWSNSGADYMKQFREFRSGIVKLLHHAQRRFDRVALLYSQPSLNTEYYHGRFADFKKAREAWLLLLHDAGLNPRFITLEGRSPSIPDDVDVLVLYRASALSDAALDALKAFSHKGGIVYYDEPFGVYDDAGVPRGKAADIASASLRRVPDVLDYPNLRKNPAAAAAFAARTFADVPASAKNVLLSTADGKPAVGVQVFPYSIGPSARVVGLLREKGGTEARVGDDGVITYVQVGQASGPLEVVLSTSAGEPFFPYDVRAGKLLAEKPVKSIRAGVNEADATLIAMLPYRVASVSIRGPRSVKPGADWRASLALAVSPRRRSDFTHVVRIAVVKQAGADWEEIPHYAANVLVNNFRGTCVVPFALGDAGRYRITARDVISGVEALQEVEVK
ncbi:MAG TPA: hypothetical protein ENN09_03725 [Planctomycetes bacterium]|nr:hypothetical protein [Planctomycetota bacterium]